MTISISNMIPTRRRGGSAAPWLASVPLLMLAQACTLEEDAPAARADDLPPAVTRQVERAMPGDDVRKAAKNVSHFAYADFDDNGLEDVAVLASEGEDWQLVIYLQVTKGRYQPVVTETFPGDDRAFKRRMSPDDMVLETVAEGVPLELDGAVIDDAGETGDGLVVRLPPSEQSVLLLRWDPTRQLFGTTRLHLAAATAYARCAYDPSSGLPNPLGMRAFVSAEEQDGNTAFVYEQFPQTLAGSAAATLAVRRELVFHGTPIDQARALMREEPGYYRELTGEDDPAGYAPVDESLTCR